MKGCPQHAAAEPATLVDHFTAVLRKHLYITIIAAVLLGAAVCLRVQYRRQKSTSDTEAWIAEEKALLEPTSPLPDLLGEYSHPLAQALFQQGGIPTSGDLARQPMFNNINLLGTSTLSSGDLAAVAPMPSLEEQRHPWRRNSHPQSKSGCGGLSSCQTEAVIIEDAVQFFKDEKEGKLWRRRTLEFGTSVHDSALDSA